ncbi:hypothetical protein DXG03_002584 [Asterophora parasitica]|uniref:Uncharacterized protein n=1 Tax=Asterophora parasitica TaxID=117018 RepID=A0A9P7G3R9_9AGAR|nr:hypothetical protein DXG03_002584 [Asterophora parasitica]
MPRDLWAIENGIEFKMRREIRPTDWPRFRKHASLVRTFSSTWTTTTEYHILDHTWYQNLYIATRGEALLPNVKDFAWFDMSWNKDAAAAFPFIPLFLGPDISTISISYQNDDNTVAALSLIASLPERYPNLTAVSFSFRDDVCAVISAAVLRWNGLQRITVESLSPDALTHIASLPSLSALTIGPAYYGMTLPSALPHSAFPALRNLSIRSEELEFSITFLRLWSTCSLLSGAEFRSNERSLSASTWAEIIGIVADKFSPSILTCLRIEDYSESRADIDPATVSEECVVPAKSLRPLLAFSNLTTVELSASHGFDIDDAFILDLAITWPRIEYLKFDSECIPHRRPCATLFSLITLAQYCPLLYTIFININARIIPDIDPNAPKVSLAALQFLNVVHSPISSGDTAKVAALLSDIFPNIETLDSWYKKLRDEEDPPENDHDKRWTEVESLIVTFVGVRNQEIARMNTRLAEAGIIAL